MLSLFHDYVCSLGFKMKPYTNLFTENCKPERFQISHLVLVFDILYKHEVSFGLKTLEVKIKFFEMLIYPT